MSDRLMRELNETLATMRGTAMAKRKAIHKRLWLSPSDCDSMAYAKYTIDSYSIDGDMEISIADCYKIINLTLQSARDLRKIERLINFLQEAVVVHKQERDR
jgi:hypothetical protein